MSVDTYNPALIQQRIRESTAVKESMLQDLAFLGTLAETSSMLTKALHDGHKLILFGNGGSAADAQHIATELVARYLHDRVALPALALTVNTSSLTAIANDDSFDNIFARQIQAFGAPGDVAVAISTSGNARSVLAAVETARRSRLITVGLTGRSGGKLRPIVDYCLCVPSDQTPRIQECHILIGHILCEIIELEFVQLPSGGNVRLRGLYAGMETFLNSRVLSLEEAILRFGREKRNGRRVVFTNGCFDLLHPGHLRTLQEARELGDVLIVGVNSDASVRQLKGEGRPLIPEDERAEMLAALEPVDAVFIFDDLTPQRVIARLLPDVLVKGGDWAGDQIVGRQEVEAAGGRVASIPVVPGYSTTELLRKIREGEHISRAES